MKKFSVGFITGLLIGGAVPVAAATVVGGTGYLFGWTVTKDGDEICDAPFIWTATREIDCD